jgi:putative peptide zinc metalloprotease protein
MPNRWKRIAVSSAGMFVELIIAAVATLCWVNAESPLTLQLLYNLIFTAGLSTILFNANALMRFDGYFILADLVQIPNLYAESATEVRRIAKRVTFGLHSNPSHYVGWRLGLTRIYGFAALLWKIVICVSLSIAASTMFAGAGIALAFIGVVMWFGRPILELSRFCQQTLRSEPPRLVRAVLVGSVLLLLAVSAICWLPIPTVVHVPAVAEYLPETLVRSRADGFVKAVHVKNNALVQEGDLLMELSNPDLTFQLERLQVTLEQNALRQRQAIDQHDASAELVLKEQRAALTNQIQQLRPQAEGLRLTAPRSGRVVARGLSQMAGRYVREGDSLLTIAEPSEKELLAIVHQNEVAEIREELGTMVPIRLAHFKQIKGKVERIDPRATNRLAAPALSALEGGTLAVRSASENEEDSSGTDDPVRLIEPHFPVHIQLESAVAAEVAAGMRTQVAVGYRTDPLAKRLRTAIRRMWHQAHEQ